MTPSSCRTAAIAAALSAITTFLLWLLPRLYEAPANFDAAIRLYDNPYYMGRLWVNFVHVFLALAGYGAAAAILWRCSPGLYGIVVTDVAGRWLTINGTSLGRWQAASLARNRPLEMLAWTFVARLNYSVLVGAFVAPVAPAACCCEGAPVPG